MTKYRSADELLDRIRSMDSAYHERAFLFVLAALEYCQQHRSERGHISGQELAGSCRDFAIDQFGLMAHSVLTFWGIRRTIDIGEIVFQLIELGLLQKQASDRLEDFAGVFEFEAAFEDHYPWPGVKHAVRGT